MNSLILSLLAFGLQITNGNITLVQTCPETKGDWDYRSSMFTCENGTMKYHCVMTNMWNLVEVCITPLNTTGNEEGCPSVYIFESSAYWIFPLTPCPVQNTECPQEGHRGYSSEELFKYPSCFRNISERTSEENEIRQTTTRLNVLTSKDVRDEIYRSDVNYIPYALTALFLLIFVIFIFIFLQNWRIQNYKKEVKILVQEKRKRSPEISISSLNSLFDTSMASPEVPFAKNLYTNFKDTANHKPKRKESHTPMASLEDPFAGNLYTNFKDTSNHKPKRKRKESHTSTAPREVPFAGNIYTNFEDTANHKQKRKESHADRRNKKWKLPL